MTQQHADPAMTAAGRAPERPHRGCLLERDDAARRVAGRLRVWPRRCAAGAGAAAVLVTGEAGIGKSSLVREFVERAAAGSRCSPVAATTCSPRARWARCATPRPAPADAGGGAARGASGRGVPGGRRRAELAGPERAAGGGPALGGRRDRGRAGLPGPAAGALPAVLVLTYRDEAVPAEHPVRRLLGVLAGGAGGPAAAGHRCPRLRCGRLAADSGWDPRVLHELSGGNPFYVTEALAAPGAEVPATVADAVLARLRRLGPRCREAVEQLSVVPTPVDFELAEALLGDRMDALDRGRGRRASCGVRGGGLVFRHELARRAVERSLSGLRRRGLHRAVVAALRRGAGAAAGPAGAPRHPGRRRRDGQPVRPARRAGGRGGRVAPAGAGALRGGAAARAPAGARGAGPGARRARLGAVQRAPLRRGAGRGRAGDRALPASWPTGAGWASRWSGCPVTATWSATPAARSGPRRRRCRCSPRPTRLRSRRILLQSRSTRPDRVRGHLLRRDPRAGRPAGGRQCRAAPGAGAGAPSRPAGPGGAVPQLPQHRRRRPGPGPAAGLLRDSLALALEHGSHETAARAYTNLGELLLPLPPARRAGPGADRRAGVLPRARIPVARLQPGGAPLPAGHAPRGVGGGPGRAARARRRRRRPGHARGVQPAAVRPAAGPPRVRRRRGAAGCGPGRGPSSSGCCSGWPSPAPRWSSGPG